jgi:hypothetical protein
MHCVRTRLGPLVQHESVVARGSSIADDARKKRAARPLDRFTFVPPFGPCDEAWTRDKGRGPLYVTIQDMGPTEGNGY